MKKISIISLFILALLALPQQAGAYYVDQSQNYTYEIKGTGSQLRIHIPLFYETFAYKYRVTDGTLKLRSGDKEAVLLRYSSSELDALEKVTATLSTDITGFLDVWSNGSEWKRLSATSSALPIAKNSSGNYELALCWDVPEEWFFKSGTELVYDVYYTSTFGSDHFTLTQNIGELKRFVADPAQYEFTANGANVRMKIPFYDKWGKDSWVKEGAVKVKADGKEETLFTFVPEGNIADANMYNQVAFTATADSTLRVFSKTATTESWVALDKTQKTVSVYGDDLYKMELQWDVPAEWLDNELEFVVQSDCNQNDMPAFTANISKTLSALSSNYYYAGDGTTPAQWNGTPSQLASTLGSTWTTIDNLCVPLMDNGNVDASNGKYFLWAKNCATPSCTSWTRRSATVIKPISN